MLIPLVTQTAKSDAPTQRPRASPMEAIVGGAAFAQTLTATHDALGKGPNPSPIAGEDEAETASEAPDPVPASDEADGEIETGLAIAPPSRPDAARLPKTAIAATDAAQIGPSQSGQGNGQDADQPSERAIRSAPHTPESPRPVPLSNTTLVPVSGESDTKVLLRHGTTGSTETHSLPQSTKSPTQEDAMQLSHPNRLRSLPSAGRLALPSAGSAPTRLPPNIHAASRILAVEHAPVVDTGHADKHASDAALPRSGRANTPPLVLEGGPQPKAQSTHPMPPFVASHSWEGKLADGQTPRSARSRVTHPTVSYDLRPTASTTPPPAPQILAAYAMVATNGTAHAPDPQIRHTSAEPIDFDPLVGRAVDTSPSSFVGKIAAPLQSASTTAEQLAAQLAQIAQTSALHRREIQLNPRELGRIRMNLNAQETTVHVAILVERIETLDLMRRYIGQLTEEFQALGYQDVSFDFAHHQQDSPASQMSEDGAPLSPPSDEAHTEAMPPRPQQQPASMGQLDLRI